MLRSLVIRWLKRQGYHVVAPGAVELVLSGRLMAVRNRDTYTVYPPDLDAPIRVVVLNGSLLADVNEKTPQPKG